MATAPCDGEMASSFGKRGMSVENLVLTGVATCWDGSRFCIRWSVDILSEMMRTLLRKISSCTCLRAVSKDFLRL